MARTVRGSPCGQGIRGWGHGLDLDLRRGQGWG